MMKNSSITMTINTNAPHSFYDGEEVLMINYKQGETERNFYFVKIIDSSTVSLYYDSSLTKIVRPQLFVTSTVTLYPLDVQSFTYREASSIGVSYGITWINNNSILTDWQTSSNLTTWYNGATTINWINNI